MLKIQNHVPIKQTLKYLSEFSRFSLIEKITPKFYQRPLDGGIALAHYIRNLIEAKRKQGKLFVLGLTSGLSPLHTYKELVRLHKEEGLSFKNVITFQLDQYYPISKTDELSYYHFLKVNLYDQVDINPENINSLNGQVAKNQVLKFCEQYEKKIQKSGGIDLQILGIGRSGHIGYNEPPSPANSRTRLVYLHRLTRKDAANLFGNIQQVPKCALTMGISTIKKARQVIFIAWSQNKAQIVKKSVQGQSSTDNPASFLYNHPNVTFYLDRQSGASLSRFTVPWTIKGDDIDPDIPRTKYWVIRSVVWLSEKLNKPILRLTIEDYEDNSLAPLAMDVAQGNVQIINLFVYKNIREKVTGWPLGDRPAHDTLTKGQMIQRKSLVSQRILIFSPHPDDDVISMGGTAHRLAQQGHVVNVAYMVPGSNAVHDYDAKKYLYFMKSFFQMQSAQKNTPDATKFYQKYHQIVNEGLQNLQNKQGSDKREDKSTIINVKSLIRSSQAKIAIQTFGVKQKNTYCLNLPFYGANKKKQPVSEQDYKIIRDLLKLTEPNVIYAAGDLTDPHGTHRKCLEIILKVVDEEYQKVAKDPGYLPLVPPPQKIFFYRGAWEQWDITVARHIVFMSPTDVEQKNDAILKHQSQKDVPMFPGDDSRQFWVRVKQRNRNTAILLKKLGLSDYEAVECFVDLNDLRDGDSI